MTALFAYQETGAAFLASRRTALLADGMGLGKTAQAIRASELVGARKILVICPAVARINWEREFQKFSTASRTVAVLTGGVRRLPDADVLIVSWDLTIRIYSLLARQRYGALILDESHMAKNPDAKRTRAVYGTRCDGRGGLCQYADRVWLLSGTPMPNDPTEVWPMLSALYPESLSRADGAPRNRREFTERYCQIQVQTFGARQIEKIVGGKNLAELRQRIEPFFLRRSPEEVLRDLPPIRYGTVTLPKPPRYDGFVPPDIKDALSDAEALARAGDHEGAASLLAAIQGDAQYTSLRRITGLAKVGGLVDLIDGDMNGGLDKLVVFTWHTEVLERLRDDLSVRGYDSVEVQGSTTPLARQRAIDSFQDPKGPRLFFGQILAAGVAITLTAASNVLIAEPPFSPKDVAQAVMRVRRIGQTRPCLARFAILDGSLADRVAVTVIKRKAELITEVFA